MVGSGFTPARVFIQISSFEGFAGVRAEPRLTPPRGRSYPLTSHGLAGDVSDRTISGLLK